MQHPYLSLKSEYDDLLSTMAVNSVAAVEAVAKKLIGPNYLPRYQHVSALTGVPAVLIAALDERESGADPNAALGQGDPWNKISKHVPIGFGPWSSWDEAAEFYVKYDHLNDNAYPWSWSYACFKAEAWNGFGPRAHGIHTGYLWSGTNHYSKGKYVADGVWNPDFVDKQLGVVPIMMRMVALCPALKFDPLAVTEISFTDSSPPSPVPLGLGGHGQHSIKWLQQALNAIILPEGAKLVVDGSYGRKTASAVRQFQSAYHLDDVDGIFGPKTDAVLSQIVSNRGISIPET